MEGQAMQKVVVPIVTLICLGVLGFVFYLFNTDDGRPKPVQAAKVAPAKVPAKQQTAQRPPEPGPKEGELAKEITGEDVDGQPFKLSDYRGKVVVLDFWGFW
jgi:cytochrome oxidase Cu insertion factor (SCO1/SenC/PrrC family)